MKVILDPKAGTCGGVRRAIHLAEEELAKNKEHSVFVLGDIIHNEQEVKRLDEAGLRTIHNSIYKYIGNQTIRPAGKITVLIRAHGEPAETFVKLANLGVEIVDGTCPVVTRSQDLAREYQQKGYQVAIVGKQGHPEMIGIIGHTDNKAVTVQFNEDIKKLNPKIPTFVMAQTTINLEWFESMVEKIKKHCREVEISNTICLFVLKRYQKLPDFANNADVILVVGGHKSSNTKMLYESCRSINQRSYHVVSTDEVNPVWFEDAETIGITGSASTPLWLLYEFIDTLNGWIDEGRL